jgi:outer membrane receptor protein involved in Fe transport
VHIKTSILLIIIIGITNIAVSQQKNETMNNGIITGKIVDENTKKPVEFSNIILFSTPNNVQVAGTVSNNEGKFLLKGIKPGNYYLYIQFIGYERKTIDNISLSDVKPSLDLGSIIIKPTVINLQNVVIESQRSPVSYDIDKKVVDVSQMHTSISGTAADVLQNVPSVSVDIDGNVSLRGSTNFTVLIDGRPSVMSAQDALQQIPAASIQTIDIITNPSAKYDAGGSAGIIDIKLKKDTNLGLSGIANLSGGLNDKYGANFLLQYKTNSVSYNFGVNFIRRSFPGTNRQDKQFIIGDNSSFLNSTGNMLRLRIISGIRGGINFDISQFDNLSIGGSYGARSFHRYSTLNYDQWTNTDPEQFYYLGNTNGNHSGSYYNINTNYSHKFDTKGHELSGEFFLSHNNNNEDAVTTSSLYNLLLNGTKTTERGPEDQIRSKIDYTLPFNKQEKFSAGAELQSRVYQDVNTLDLYDSASGNYNFQSLYSNTNDFNFTNFAVYTLFSNQWDSLGVQLGFRTEHTYQKVRLANTNQQFSFSRWDYFPSLHSSYSLAGGLQLLASYSRRIDRPDGGELEPFYTWQDANNIRLGNPNLKPELIDSYELGYQTFFGPVSFSNDFYYRYTHGKIEQINSVYAENVTLNSIANIGIDYSLGTEFMMLFNPVKFWELNLMGDVYDYRLKGAISNQDFAKESFNWSIKNNNVFKITTSTSFQLNTRYFSPSVSAQGRWEGYFVTDLAIKQDLDEKHISLTLQVNDIFKTGKREFTSQGSDFYNYNYFTQRAPMVMLDIKFNFNNYHEQRQKDNNLQDNGNNQGD